MKHTNLPLLIMGLLTLIVFTESCKKKEICPTYVCNTGTINLETCVCDCPDGFSGTNCEIEDICITQEIVCQNNGSCVNGVCECPTGFVGPNCEFVEIDITQIQVLLDNGETPKNLFQRGATLDQLYGKMYQGGLIFYLDTIDGHGMVAATEDQGTEVEWGCEMTDIMDLSDVLEKPTDPETEEGARVGDGKANTDKILNNCMTDGIAARLCRDIGEEWFLPSRGELTLMFRNLHDKGHSEFALAWYWSSSENGIYVWCQRFKATLWTDDYRGKGFRTRVRAARAF